MQTAKEIQMYFEIACRSLPTSLLTGKKDKVKGNFMLNADIEKFDKIVLFHAIYTISIMISA
jgi:hypothetical protein